MAFGSSSDRSDARKADNLPRAGDEVRVRGRLTDEGIECPALRGTDGRLYTLVGDLRGFRIGDEVCVGGRVADMSFCMQGTTIEVSRIGPADTRP